MTCQVILGNGHGLAIASDTTVTIDGRSTHDTAQKIHPMRLPHRMAVLHAGSVNFHGMPYGVLIEEWIHSLGDVQLRYVDAYVNSFVDWLTTIWNESAVPRIAITTLSTRYAIGSMASGDVSKLI